MQMTTIFELLIALAFHKMQNDSSWSSMWSHTVDTSNPILSGSSPYYIQTVEEKRLGSPNSSIRQPNLQYSADSKAWDNHWPVDNSNRIKRQELHLTGMARRARLAPASEKDKPQTCRKQTLSLNEWCRYASLHTCQYTFHRLNLNFIAKKRVHQGYVPCDFIAVISY